MAVSFFYRFIPSLFRSVIMATVVAASIPCATQKLYAQLAWIGRNCLALHVAAQSFLRRAINCHLPRHSVLSRFPRSFWRSSKLPIRNTLLRKTFSVVVSIASVSLAVSLQRYLYWCTTLINFTCTGCLPICFPSPSCRLRCGLRLQVSCFKLSYHPWPLRACVALNY